ncbi:tRNA epoxyqueuosine(34) reductase QueG [uncultured Parabacteroides sp.]|jgi:epoxyqueuosine reductase|uniref:tRNA epoxyqueuosine(34) reductase QueG n=1 Tax=uncultured Parabacteroides sp. TaxID=512312 RepID=UPI0025CE7286|nr:tRNA epoxyqueuosine(34) reductase QueG [uncultured Parabacteroides sp.]
MNLSVSIKDKAKELGFDACGIAEVSSADTEALFFDRWIAEGYHAGMKYMENYRDIRLDPTGLVESARSVISVALNYYPSQKQSPDAPRISYYAYGKDYHVVLKDKLRQLWKYITEELLPSIQVTTLSSPGQEQGIPYSPAARIFTDSAPLLERYWAWKAGLGWIGKNTNLIIPGKGSFFFLGEIVTTLELDYDSPRENRCGDCRRCLDACPTGALESAGHLNANKCISYLTIEHKGDIPSQYAARLGDRLYGCDTCQEVCPWNRFARPTREAAFSPSPAFLSLKKEDLQNFTRDDYNRIFAGSAVKRAKYEGLIRTINNKKDKP